MKKNNIYTPLFAVSLCLLTCLGLLACKDKDVVSYQLPKAAKAAEAVKPADSVKPADTITMPGNQQQAADQNQPPAAMQDAATQEAIAKAHANVDMKSAKMQMDMMGGQMGQMGMGGSQMGMPAAEPASSYGIKWDLPAGWTEKPASSMRVGSFSVTGKNGQNADISIIPISGNGGGDLPNINRWRGQIGLGPVEEKDLGSISERIEPAGRSMILVNMVSNDNLIENKYKTRIVAAAWQQGEKTWFFKMIGEDETVQSAKDSFVQLLASLKFN